MPPNIESELAFYRGEKDYDCSRIIDIRAISNRQLLISLMMALQELGNIELLLGKGIRSNELAFSMYKRKEEKVIALFGKIIGVVQSIRDERKKYDYLETNFSDILHRHIDLSIKEPVKVERYDKVKIIYNQENSKSYISLD